MGGRCSSIALFGLSLGLAACPDPTPPIPEGLPPLRRAVAELGHPRSEVRIDASNRLEGMVTTGLNGEEARWVLRAARRRWPEAPLSGRLVDWAMRGQPGPELLPAIREVWSELPPSAQDEVLRGLTVRHEAGAAQLFGELVIGLENGEIGRLDLTALRESPDLPQHYFPALFSRLDSADWFEVTHTTLGYLENGVLSPEATTLAWPRWEARWRKIHPALQQADAQRGLEWRWEDEYQSPRADAALILDVLGYLDTPEAHQILKQALPLRDPRLRVFAITSALQQGLAVPKDRVSSVAKFPEVRCLLYDRLLALDAVERLPPEHRTQAALAEGDLARWLAHPNELGRAADQLELYRVEQQVEAGAPLEWYLFRFRMEAPHPLAERGWMAGISGPFSPGNIETHGTGTFSDFVSWGELEPDEHSANLRARTQASEEAD